MLGWREKKHRPHNHRNIRKKWADVSTFPPIIISISSHQPPFVNSRKDVGRLMVKGLTTSSSLELGSLSFNWLVNFRKREVQTSQLPSKGS